MARPLRVLMICAHEPTLDPRIRWEAGAGADRFDVTVLGFNRDDGAFPELESVDGYRVVRLRRKEISALAYFWRLKDNLPVFSRIVLGILTLSLSPVILPAELLVELLRRAVRPAIAGAPGLTVSSPRPQGTRISNMIGLVRGGILGRLQHILVVLRVQFATAAWQFWNYLRDSREKPEIVHCNDLDTLLVGVLAKQHYGCRLVYDAHEFYPMSDPQGRWVDITFFSVLERFLIRQADAVVTVNPPLAEAMRGTYGLERVVAVPNAEPWIEGRPNRAAGSEMARLAKGRVKFLFQGRFAPGRGIDELIEDWADVDGSQAVLFLRGPDNFWRLAAIDLAARLGLLNRSIFFLDAVVEDRLIPAAAEADVGIIPYKPLIINDRLSCPNKLSQYLHAGLLVIANDLPYVKSVLSAAQSGLFYSSAEPGSLAAVIDRLLADPELLRSGRENALRFAREEFNWHVQGEALYALYRAPDDETLPVSVGVDRR
jgi:glycosyltransferase involved in cell wall biosynthesis